MRPFYRIIYHTKSLNHEIGTILFKLIESLDTKERLDIYLLDNLKQFGDLFIDKNPIGDVAKTDDFETFVMSDIDNEHTYCLAIIINSRQVPNPGELVPLLLLQRHFKRRITIGVDLEEYSVREQSYVAFKLSYFLLFIDNIKPICGNNSLYFLNEKKELRTSGKKNRCGKPYYYVSKNKVTVLKYKKRQSAETIEKAIENASRYFHPLMHIDKNTFDSLFQNIPSSNSHEINYIEKSIEKLTSQLSFVTPPIQGYSSLFEKWFFLAFYWSLSDDELEELNIDAFNSTLHDYYIGIYELVQNIIFHTQEGCGWLYVMFCKDEGLSQEDILRLGEDALNVKRYLKIGVYDFSEWGITDTFCKNNGISEMDLSQLVNPDIIPDIEDNTGDTISLSLTYAAHLGIKMLVSSIRCHNGWFRVESCQRGHKCSISGSSISMETQTMIRNVPGSHYEILLPVAGFKQGSVYPIQVSYINDFLKTQVKDITYVDAINLSECIDSDKQSGASSSDEQWGLVNDVANRIVKEYEENSNSKNVGICALNMEGSSFQNPNQILKLLAYIQLKKQFIDTIVLVNLQDSDIAHMCRLLTHVSGIKTEKKQPLWSRDHAVVLYGNTFGAQILCGETTWELKYINQRMSHVYPGYYNYFTDIYTSQKKEAQVSRFADRLIIPYECIVRVNGVPLFLKQVSLELNKPIGGTSGGYLVDEFRSKLGSKLYMERFYEADTMFQNGFFVDRFAFFIASDIIKRKLNTVELQGKPIVILGYLSYSEPISRRVQYYVNQAIPGAVSQVITAIEMDDGSNDMAFHWHNMHNETLSDFDDRYIYASLVPISSTLSSHDKTISLFKKNTGCAIITFPFQYSVLLIHDKIVKEGVTYIEKEWGISKIAGSTINAIYKESQYVNFLVSKESIWHNLVDEFTFPACFKDEIFLNRTENASLNIRDFFGFPMAALPDDKDMVGELKFIYHENNQKDNKEDYYRLTCKRLQEFRDYIQIGHIEHHGNHHRYYFNTEAYIGRDGNFEFKRWLDYQKHRLVDLSVAESSCVIITPDVNKESCFVDMINEMVFGGKALVVHLDVFSSAQNISFKYAFLRQLPEDSKFFFVDHAILTSGTFERARLLLSFAQNNKDYVFDGLITLVNRLSYSLLNQIRKEIGKCGIESYLWFSIFPSKNTYTECSLCGLERHYKNLGECSVINNGRVLCKHNKKKFRLSQLNYYTITSKSSELYNQETAKDNRRMSRLQACYKLFYHISLLAIEGMSKTGKSNASSNVSQINISNSVIDYLGREYESIKDDIDKKISFLKAVTFPPLSQYVYIRQYAFKKNLEELYLLFEKSSYEYDDFCLLRVLLKHLSYLSSNALVRKDVIVGSWNLYRCVLHRVEKDIASLQVENSWCGQDNNHASIKKFSKSPDLFFVSPEDRLKDLLSKKEKLDKFNSNMLFYIKNAMHNDESKSFFLGELLRTGMELDVKKSLQMHPSVEAFFANDLIGDAEFLTFVDWLYYDNNAILRKTLYNFEKELSKEATGLGSCFFKEGSLVPYDDFEKNINAVVELLLENVKDNYYYSWFRLFVSEDSISTGQLIDINKDGVPLVRKLVYVLYAKQLLDSIEGGGGHGFINDVNTLLRIASSVMDAKDAFVSIKYNGHYNILTQLNKNNDESTARAFDTLLEQMSNDLEDSPFVIYEEEDRFKGILSCHYKKGCFLPLFDDGKNKRKLIGCVTFLYDNDAIKFKIRKRECGRLLLLLCEELDKYVIHCKKEKFIDIWETKRIYRKTNFTSNHRLHLGSWDFESLDTDSFVKIYNGLFMLSNVVVGHVYSVLSEEKKMNFNARSISIRDIFSEKFIALLQKLNLERWGGTLRPVILGNHDFTLKCNVVIMQSLIIQCLENASGKYADKSKIISISFNDNSFAICNSIVNVDSGRLEKDKAQFELKYNEKTLEQNIRHSRLSDYGMTLVSLYAYCKSVGIECNWIFRVQPTAFFKLEIQVNKQNNRL